MDRVADRLIPWQRQPGESRQAYAAFEAYRDDSSALTDGRSLRRTAACLGKSRRLLAGWSARWSWVERCDEYDFSIYRLRNARQLADVNARAALTARLVEATKGVHADGSVASIAGLSDEDFALLMARSLSLEELVGLIEAGALGFTGIRAAAAHEAAGDRDPSITTDFTTTPQRTSGAPP